MVDRDKKREERTDEFVGRDLKRNRDPYTSSYLCMNYTFDI